MLRHARCTVACAVTVSLALLASVAHAQSTWNVTSGSWADAGNWLGGVPSGIGAIADFSKVNLATTGTVVTGTRTVGTMIVGDTDGSNSYDFTQIGGGNGGQITWDVSSGVALLQLTGGATFRSGVWALSDSLDIQQNGSGSVTSYAGINTSTNLRTITLTGTGSGPFAFTGAGSTIQGSNLKIVVDNPNGLFGIGASTGVSAITASYAGGTEVKKGTFSYRSSTQNFSAAGGVTLGETSGTSNATFRIVSDNTRSVSKAFTLAANSSGTLKIAADGESTGTRTYTFSGGVTGSYGLTLENAGGDENLSFTTSALDFTGALTHTGTGTGLLTISSTIGTNVTGVTQSSTTSRMILNAANTYAGPTTITAGTLSLGASASLASGTISVASGARFDVTSVTGGFTLGSGKTLGGLGTIAGSGSFAAGSFLAFDQTGPLNATSTLSFDSFGITSLANVNWDSLTLDTPYTLISGTQNFNTTAGLLNTGTAGKVSVGSSGREAYLQPNGNNLELVVVPEPATIALALGGLATMSVLGIRRLRRRSA